jgi:hypothetical protein
MHKLYMAQQGNILAMYRLPAVAPNFTGLPASIKVQRKLLTDRQAFTVLPAITKA